MILNTIVISSRDAGVQQLAQEIAEQVFSADSVAELIATIDRVNPELVILDSDLDNACELRKTVSDTPIALITEQSDNMDIPTCRLVQPDCLESINQIAARIKSGLPQKIENTDYFAEDFAAEVSMVGLSRSTLETTRMIKLVAQSHCNPVLIVGETGTGKELAAKAVHNLRNPGRNFIAVNCAALTETLLESELFGHVRGAFTGADKDKTGLLELAGNGTIFLDEISEMPMQLQAKLLRLLQEKNFRKVGGTSDLICQATIIASSNRNLKKDVQENKFRQDLYYRLNIAPINIAPLRSQHRSDDIVRLAEYFLKTSTIHPEKAASITGLTKMAMEIIQNHKWPGNIRELKNVIDRAVLLETTDKIGLSSIIIDPLEQEDKPHNPGHIKEFSLEKAERTLIERALNETGWQKTKAAALLGITRATLYAKVKQYKIEKSENKADSVAVAC